MAARIRSVIGDRGMRGGVALWHACDIVETCWWRALPVCLWDRILAVFMERLVYGVKCLPAK
ncbi:hypothetical protein GCM10023262_11680 [Bartonella pachyuromydis]|uniref:Uncharacterized protein n=1 Tax=Bartonella pachyuromydis TaxID=931097 RepID=A0ABP8VI73_9HYPH